MEWYGVQFCVVVLPNGIRIRGLVFFTHSMDVIEIFISLEPVFMSAKGIRPLKLSPTIKQFDILLFLSNILMPLSKPSLQLNLSKMYSPFRFIFTLF